MLPLLLVSSALLTAPQQRAPEAVFVSPIINISPTTGTAGTQVRFTVDNVCAVVAVRFGRLPATFVNRNTFGIVGFNLIDAIVPDGAITAPIYVDVCSGADRITLASNIFFVVPGTFARGDANGDGSLTVADVMYLINHLFTGGPAPAGAGDVNGDDQVTVSDVFYLIEHLFNFGPLPR